MTTTTKPVKLVACINVFNEPLLDIVLSKAYPYFDQFIIADGAYVGRSPKPRSNPKTRRTIRDFKRYGPSKLLAKHNLKIKDYPPKPTTIIMKDSFWESEVAKRNAMLEKVPDGAWYFYMDGEWITKWEPDAQTARQMILSLPEEVDSLSIFIGKPWAKIGNIVPLYEYQVFGAFRKRKGVHFVYNHSTLADGDGILVHHMDDWINADDKIAVYDEVQRPNQPSRTARKITMWEKGQYTEMSNGRGKFVCHKCGHGNSINEEGKMIGFVLPAGRFLKCPICGSGLLSNPEFINIRKEIEMASKMTEVK